MRVPHDVGEIDTLELIEVGGWNKTLLQSVKQIQQHRQSLGNARLQISVKKNGCGFGHRHSLLRKCHVVSTAPVYCIEANTDGPVHNAPGRLHAGGVLRSCSGVVRRYFHICREGNQVADAMADPR